MKNRRRILRLFGALGFMLLAQPAPSHAVDTAPTPAAPPISLGIDTFGLPTSLTILEGEKPREDLELKETARFYMIAAHKAFFEGNYSEAMSRIQEGLQKGFYIHHQKRILSRVYYMEGSVDTSIAVARELASETTALAEDKIRLEFLEAVNRYLKVSLETQPIAFRAEATVHGDEKARHRFITPVGLEVDPFGRILQTSFGTNEVVVFSKGLEYEMKLSGMSNPFDVAVDPDGSIYVSSFGNDKIYRFSREGVAMDPFGKKGSGPGEFFGPEGIVISPDRYIYVVDGGNHRVQKFTLEGRHLMSFGSRGTKPGQFSSPREILIQTSPGSDSYSLLVMAQEGNLLQQFDRYGNFLGKVSTSTLAEPRDVDWFGENRLLFCTAKGELILLDLAADTLTSLQDERDQPLVIDGLSGLSVDDEAGLIYVANQAKSELHVLRPASVGQKTLLTISDLNFAHYPYIGVTLQVTTGGGDPITGLSRRNFAIEEDNHRVVPISVRALTQTGQMNLIVHLDPSSSLDRRTVLIRSFLSDLSKELPPVFFMSVRKGRKVLREPTDNPYLIRKSLDRISEPVAGSLVRDIYESMASLKGVQGRRNLLIVTSREDDLPADQYAPLLSRLINESISVFVLHLTDKQLPVLKTLCTRTGGYYRRLKETSINDMAFELATSKTASYFLVYASPYGELQTNVPVDLTLRLFYLTDAVLDRIRYFAP